MRYWNALLGFCLLLALPLTAEAAGQKILQNAATAVASGSNVTLDNAGAAGVSAIISGTATLAFEGSADGGVTWAGLTCTNVTTLASVISVTATGQFQCPIAGLSHFRTPINACTSCTVTSTATTSSGSLGIGGGGSVGITSLGTSTAAAPTLAEGANSFFSFDLAGNARVTLGTLLAGEDQTNNGIMVFGAATRLITFSSVTSATTSTTQTVFVGPKTFMAYMGGASETKAFDLTIYGNWQNSTTGGRAVCRIYVPSTASTTHIEARCPVVEENYTYWYYTADTYTSASAASLTLYAMQ